MSRMLEMLRGEHRARAFLLTYAQSSLGNGMAIVALLVIAYDRKPSPWAITLVLLAYDLPPGFLSPLAGALVDRLSRRWCVIAADLVWLALGHFLTALVLAVTIVGIPFAWAHLKLAGLALWPIGKMIVPA